MIRPLITTLMHILVTVLMLVLACARMAAAECPDELRRCLDHLQAMINSTQAVTIHFTLVTSQANGSHDTDHVQITRVKARQHTRSRQLSIAEDESAIVYVSEAERRVIIQQQSPMRSATPEALQQFTALLTSPGSVTCSAARNGRMVYVVDLKNTTTHGLVQAVEVETESDARIVSITTRYTSGSKVISMQMSNVTVRAGTDDRPLPDALSLLYVNKKLKPEFNSYSIIDLRRLKP